MPGGKVFIRRRDGRVEVRDATAGTIEESRIEFTSSDNMFADLGD